MSAILVFLAVVFVFLLLIVFWMIGMYNRLVQLRNQVDQMWANIDVLLKRRFDLIPNLVETVKGYMKHERETLEAVTRARAAVAQARAQVKAAEAAYALAQDAHRRQRPLFEQGIISPLEYQNLSARRAQAEAQVLAAKAGLAQSEERLEGTRVVAPFDGVVDARRVEPGEQVNPGQPMLRVVDTPTLKARAGVPERYAAEVQVGAQVRVRFKAYGLEPRTGAVSYVGLTIDPKTRTFPVEVRLENPDGRLKPEMVARLQLTRGRLPAALVVPQNAVLLSESGRSVFVVEPDATGALVARRRAVVLGPRAEGRAVIAQGLRPGDRVVVLGQASLTEGDRVEERRGDG